MDAERLVTSLRKLWYVPIAALILGAILAFIYTNTITPVYKAESRVFISTTAVKDYDPDTDNPIYTAAYWRSQVKSQIETYAVMAMTPVVLDPVAEQFGGELPGEVTVTGESDTLFLVVETEASTANGAAALANATTSQIQKMIVDVESVAQTDVAPPILVKAVDPAVPPDEPFYPRVLPNVLVGGLLGLLLGVGLVLLRAVLDRTVRTQQGLEKVVGGPMLAKVPQDRSMKDELFVALNQHSYNSEGFRMLRANLEFVDPDHNPRIIAVASAQASEGKTTVACNLAITLATAGNRVCLVDADLRRGTVANVLGIESSVGLSDVLARRVDPKEAALKWRRGLLTVLPTGSKAPNPSELLGSATMQKLLKLLRESFDYVILDTSPITVVSDPKYVVAMAEGTIVVARYGITTWNQLKTTKDEIDRVGGRILGSVFNGVPDGSRSYGYYSSYHSTKDIKQPSEDIAMDAVARN